MRSFRLCASPDANPVDQHLRRVGARARVAAAGTGNREVEHRVDGVAGAVERPIRHRVRGNVEIGLRALDPVFPEADAGCVPLASPGVPTAVQRDIVGLPFAAVGFRMHGGGRWPAAVAVPLDDVDLALVLISQPVGGPAAGSEAFELDPCLPGVADPASPEALDLAAVKGGAIFRGPKNQVRLAIDKDVAAIVAVLADVLGQLPVRWVFDYLARFGDCPLRRIRR